MVFFKIWYQHIQQKIIMKIGSQTPKILCNMHTKKEVCKSNIHKSNSKHGLH